MNRRRILSSVHRSIASKSSTALAPVDHSTIERLSTADLNLIGPRLVTSAPREKHHCIYCWTELHVDAYFPFCSSICAINSENS